VAVRVGHTWELALARLGGAAKGSALRPLITVKMAVLGGLPLLAWGILWRGSVLEAGQDGADELVVISPSPEG